MFIGRLLRTDVRAIDSGKPPVDGRTGYPAIFPRAAPGDLEELRVPQHEDPFLGWQVPTRCPGLELAPEDRDECIELRGLVAQENVLLEDLI